MLRWEIMRYLVSVWVAFLLLVSVFVKHQTHSTPHKSTTANLIPAKKTGKTKNTHACSKETLFLPCWRFLLG